jgi:YD repeat-containing protein
MIAPVDTGEVGMGRGRVVTRGLAGRAALLLALATVALGTAPAAAQTQNGGSISGTTLTAVLVSPNGQPVFVWAVQFTTDQAGNVSALSCPSGSTSSATGGPNGSPECIFTNAVMTATIVFTGRSAWPSTVTLAPSYSFNGSTYQSGTPFTVQAAGTSTTTTTSSTSTTTTTSTTKPSSGNAAEGESTKSSSGSDDTWIWVLVVVLGVALIVLAWVLFRRRGRHVVALTYDDQGNLVSVQVTEVGGTVPELAYGAGPVTDDTTGGEGDGAVPDTGAGRGTGPDTRRDTRRDTPRDTRPVDGGTGPAR